MASTPSTRNRLEKQGAGENSSTWGAPKLNTVIDLVDASLDGRTNKALSGNVTLSSTNYAADESRQRMLVFTGTGAFQVTIPSVEKWYIVGNSLTGDLTITTGGGTSAVLGPGQIAIVTCDGTNCNSSPIGPTFAKPTFWIGSGSVIVGDNSAVSDPAVGTPPLQAKGSVGDRAAALFRTDGAASAYVGFYLDGTGLAGSVVGNGGGGVNYNTTSDYRLKTVRSAFSGSEALSLISEAKIYMANWRSAPEAPPEPMILAHEFAEILPSAVTGEKDGEAMQMVDLSKAVPLLLAAIQELQARIKALECA